MSPRLHRAGAVCFALWGLVHVLGGASMLLTLRGSGGAEVYRMLASANPAAVPDAVPALASAVVGFHAWNLLWIGALVTAIALTLNWRNRAAGLWLNLTLAGAADVGMVASLLLPGYIKPEEAMIGIGLLALAAPLAVWGRVAGGRAAAA